MQQISHRRMERWLDRETAKLRGKRRYGLCCMRVEDPSEPGGARFILGEAVPALIKIGNIRYLRPVLMGVCAVRPGSSWAGMRRGKLKRSDRSAAIANDRARNKRVAQAARELAQAQDDRAKELSHAILRALGQKVQVGGAR